MKHDLDKLLLGFILGGLIGGSAFYLLRANKEQKKLFFKKIGKIIDEIGESFQEIGIEEERAALDEIAKALSKKKSVSNILMLAAMSLNLWKKWR